MLPTASIDEVSEHRLTAAVLVIANLLPLLCVLFAGWKTYDVIMVYWLENVVLGVLNLPRMALAWAPPDEGTVGKVFGKLFSLPFFCFHYGMFCMGHGALIVQVLAPGGDLEGGEGRQILHVTEMGEAVRDDFAMWQWACVAVFATSHLISFGVNYVGRGEWRRYTTQEVMFFPYGRVVLLHIAVLCGGFLSVKLGSPLGILVLLVVGKTLLDLMAHLAEHRSAAD